MTETEEEILDELYFVTPFTTLAQTLAVEENALCQALQVLVAQGYVKCFFPDPDTEVDFDPADCTKYFFLATKAGLLAHNSR